MSVDLSAPRTLREWQRFAVAVLVLYVLLLSLATRDPMMGVTMGIYSGFITIIGVAVVVFFWRGVREAV